MKELFRTVSFVLLLTVLTIAAGVSTSLRGQSTNEIRPWKNFSKYKHIKTMTALFLSQPQLEKADTILLLVKYGEINTNNAFFLAYVSSSEELVGMHYKYDVKYFRKKVLEGRAHYYKRLLAKFEPIQETYDFEPIKNLSKFFNKGVLDEAYLSDHHWRINNPFTDSHSYYRYSIFVRREGVLVQVNEGVVGYWIPDSLMIQELLELRI